MEEEWDVEREEGGRTLLRTDEDVGGRTGGSGDEEEELLNDEVGRDVVWWSEGLEMNEVRSGGIEVGGTKKVVEEEGEYKECGSEVT
jgi:hypothetical protein